MDATLSRADVRSRIGELKQSVEKLYSVRLVGGAGVTASVAVLLVTAVVLAGTAARVLVYAEEANRGQHMLNSIDALQEALSTVSVAGRAYIIGHDPHAAATRDQAARKVRHLLATFDSYSASNIETAAQIRETNLLIKRRLDMFDLATAQGGPPSPQWELNRIQLIQRTNAVIAGLRVRAATELSLSQQHIVANIRVAISLALFAAATAPVLGVIGITLLRRERDSLRARELQMELMHVQRLAVMGETSTMLAHEINQPLTAAANYLAVQLRHIDAGAPDKAREIAQRIGQQIQRASAILRKLRRFVEKREAEHSLEAPETLVDDALTLLGTLDSSIQLETRIASDLPLVKVDRVQIQQVLVNLMRNAIEAMESMPRRDLLLGVARRDDGYVEVSLADSGPGIEPDIAVRLFQPFVTSKSGGMGVGLSISRSIIEQHGGKLWAEANPHGGTLFRFTLPSAKQTRVPRDNAVG